MAKTSKLLLRAVMIISNDHSLSHGISVTNEEPAKFWLVVPPIFLPLNPYNALRYLINRDVWIFGTCIGQMVMKITIILTCLIRLNARKRFVILQQNKPQLFDMFDRLKLWKSQLLMDHEIKLIHVLLFTFGVNRGKLPRMCTCKFTARGAQ